MSVLVKKGGEDGRGRRGAKVLNSDALRTLEISKS